MNWSLGIQHQLKPSVVATVQYVGSSSWDQNDTRAINTLPLTNNPSNSLSTAAGGSTVNAPTITDPNNPSGPKIVDPRWLGDYKTNPYTDRYGVQSGQILTNKVRQYPGFAGITQEENETNAHYNSLQAGVRIENKWGLTSQVAYTFSHLLDSGNGTGDLGAMPNPFNSSYGEGSGALDRRHVFNVSYVYALPFAKHASNGAVKAIIGGWGISGITVFQTGLPVNVTYNGTDTLGLGGGTTNRPNLVAPVSFPKTQKAWFSTSSYADPVAPWFGGPNQGFGAAGKDNVRGPGLNNFNLTLSKSIQLTGHEGPAIDLRFESFNTFNKTQFNGINSANHDSNFGQVTSIYNPRNLEITGKFRF
jgi:hypothetical protein